MQSDAHRWVISYADFITLLFAFFVVMYAISSVNDSKYQSLSEGLHSAFNKQKKNVAVTPNARTEVIVPKAGEGQDSFKALQSSLNALGSGDFKISGQEGYIEIDMDAAALFVKGSADLRPEAIIKLMKTAEIIKNLNYPVSLEGYTDNIPINTPKFPSNWELSAARAAAVGRVLNNFGVSSNRISVTGFGEQFPIANNDNEDGQNKNRRVTIIIAKDRSVERLRNPTMIQHQRDVVVPLIN